MAGILEEGPIRKLLREKGFKRSPESPINISLALDNLVNAENEIRAARTAISAEHFSEAQTHIEAAHEWLRHGSAALGK